MVKWSHNCIRGKTCQVSCQSPDPPSLNQSRSRRFPGNAARQEAVFSRRAEFTMRTVSLAPVP